MVLPSQHHWDMTVDSKAATMNRQERALTLALAGVSDTVIAATVGYANRAGAWKGIRAALERRTSLCPDELTDQLRERQRHYEAQGRARALADLLVLGNQEGNAAEPLRMV